MKHRMLPLYQKEEYGYHTSCTCGQEFSARRKQAVLKELGMHTGQYRPPMRKS